MSVELGFFLELPATEVSPQAPCDWMPLPNHSPRALLSMHPVPQLVPLEAGEQLKTPSVCFERVTFGMQDYLVMSVPALDEVRINGLPAPPAAVLHVKDHIRVGAISLHVSVMHRPCVETAGAEIAGSECLVCRTPIGAGQSIFRCTHCGVPMHAGNPSLEPGNQLECHLTATECAGCQRQLVREKGHEYVPQF